MVKLEIILSPDEADLILRAVDCAREAHHPQGKDPSAETRAHAVDETADKTSAGTRTRAAGETSDETSAETRARAVDDLSAETPSDGTRPSGPATHPPLPRASPSPSRADGMIALAESYLAGNAGTGNGGERFQVMVHLDQDPLAPDGVLAGTLDDGTHLSDLKWKPWAGFQTFPRWYAASEARRLPTRQTLRRVACDCGLLAQAGHDEPSTAPAGRRSRSIPPAIRRALWLRDRGCVFPGCTHGRFLHAHHIQHWLHGGPTTMTNLGLLCGQHHHLVHEGGWSLTRTADGELRFKAPDGHAVPAMPAREASDDAVVWVREWAEERGLDLGAETNVPFWDGTRPDYDWAVAALVATSA